MLQPGGAAGVEKAGDRIVDGGWACGVAFIAVWHENDRFVARAGEQHAALFYGKSDPDNILGCVNMAFSIA